LALNGMISLGSEHGPAYPDPTNLTISPICATTPPPA
jgi:hypothetical protein